MSLPGSLETEVKIRVADLKAEQTRLLAAGFLISAPRVFESNTLFDTPGLDLKSQRKMLRIRQLDARPGALLTWKGPPIPGPHKSRAEFETRIESPIPFAEILKALGYEPSFRYEKYRTEYRGDREYGEGVVTLDETPIGHFMELEGGAGWIDSTAELLGYKRSHYILASYGRLYLDHCTAQGIAPTHMLFGSSYTRE